MKKSVLVLFVSLFLANCASNEKSEPVSTPETTTQPAAAYTANTTFDPDKGVLMEQAARVTAAVIGVDKADRSITVRDAQGEVMEIDLTEDVKNFDQIAVGDDVVLEVYSALAMKLAEPGEEFEDKASTMVAVAKPGEKPKAVNVDVVEVLAKITEIDRATREVTVQGPRGHSVTVQVPEDIEKFDQLRVGDKVNARYIQAFAVSVQKLN